MNWVKASMEAVKVSSTIIDSDTEKASRISNTCLFVIG